MTKPSDYMREILPETKGEYDKLQVNPMESVVNVAHHLQRLSCALGRPADAAVAKPHAD